MSSGLGLKTDLTRANPFVHKGLKAVRLGVRFIYKISKIYSGRTKYLLNDIFLNGVSPCRFGNIMEKSYLCNSIR